MINLFEYQNKQEFKGDLENIEVFLDDIWSRRKKSGYYYDESENQVEVQRFLQIFHKDKKLKSNKYVGVIKFEGYTINLLPKIFFDEQRTYSDRDIEVCNSHVLWWLSYCRKIKFPNYLTSLGSQSSDFFEILIYLFAKYTRKLLSNSIYQQYEDIDRELNFIKGRLDASAYIRENISRGRWHKVNCSYDSFEFDNKFNRIIKYVSTLLFSASGNADNKKNLREILFILDEVTDETATAEECAHLKFNPMFGEYDTIRDYCLLFLQNSISINYKNNLKLFAFLLPMEYVFEDFIFGFIDREVSGVNAKAQSTSKYLSEGKKYQLCPDLILNISKEGVGEERKIIADTKYKIVYSDSDKSLNGISQNDLYQMLAYAVRYEIGDIVLFYPNTIKKLDSFTEQGTELRIKDEFATDKEMRITVNAYQLPIINFELVHHPQSSNNTLQEIFKSTKETLKKALENIFAKQEQ